MPDFKTYISDPDFFKLSPPAQMEVLNNDPDFAALSQTAKMEVIRTYAPGRKDTSPKSLADISPSIAQTGMEIIGGLGKTMRGRILATGIASAGGEAIKQLYQHATEQYPGVEFEPGVLKNISTAPTSTTESLRRMGEATLIGAGLQAGPEVVLRGAGKLIPKVAKEYIIPGTEEAESALAGAMKPYLKEPGMIRKTGEKIGILTSKETPGLTIAQKTEPLSGASKMESIIRSSFFGGTPIKRFEFAQEQAIKDMAKGVSDHIWDGVRRMPPSEQGKAFIKVYDTMDEKFTIDTKVLYDTLDDLVAKGKQKWSTIKRPSPILQESGQPFIVTEKKVSDRIVNLSGLKGKVEAFRQISAEIADVGLSEVAGQTVKKLTALDKNLSFAAAHELRSRLLSEARMLEGHEKAAGVIKSLVEDVSGAMETAAKKSGPDIYGAWRKADDFYKKGMEELNNDYIANLVRYATGPSGQPELIGKKVFQNGEITQIKLVKKIADQDTWQAMKAGWMQDLLSSSTTPEGITQGNKVFEKLKAMSGKDMKWWEGETIKEIFNQGEINVIKKFEQAARLSQKMPGGGGGSMLIQLIQAGPLAAAVTLRPLYDDKIELEEVLGGVALLVTPRILGNMLVTKKYQDLFIKGLNTSRPIALPAIAKLAKGALELNKEYQEYKTPESILQRDFGYQ